MLPSDWWSQTSSKWVLCVCVCVYVYLSHLTHLAHLPHTDQISGIGEVTTGRVQSGQMVMGLAGLAFAGLAYNLQKPGDVPRVMMGRVKCIETWHKIQTGCDAHNVSFVGINLTNWSAPGIRYNWRPGDLLSVETTRLTPAPVGVAQPVRRLRARLRLVPGGWRMRGGATLTLCVHEARCPVVVVSIEGRDELRGGDSGKLREREESEKEKEKERERERGE